MSRLQGVLHARLGHQQLQIDGAQIHAALSILFVLRLNHRWFAPTKIVLSRDPKSCQAMFTYTLVDSKNLAI